MPVEVNGKFVLIKATESWRVLSSRSLLGDYVAYYSCDGSGGSETERERTDGRRQSERWRGIQRQAERRVGR